MFDIENDEHQNYLNVNLFDVGDLNVKCQKDMNVKCQTVRCLIFNDECQNDLNVKLFDV